MNVILARASANSMYRISYSNHVTAYEEEMAVIFQPIEREYDNEVLARKGEK